MIDPTGRVIVEAELEGVDNLDFTSILSPQQSAYDCRELNHCATSIEETCSPNGLGRFFCSCKRVKCSEIFKIGSGCLRESSACIRTTFAGQTYRARDRADIVDDGSTTGCSSVSILLILLLLRSSWKAASNAHAGSRTRVAVAASVDPARQRHVAKDDQR